MRRAVIHDPEHPGGRAIGFLRHDVGYQPIKRANAILGFTAAKHFGSADIPGGQVNPSPATLILIFNPHGLPVLSWQGWMLPQACLNRGFLISGQHILSRPQGSPIPNPFVEIQDGGGLFTEVRVAGKDPAAVAPWTDRVLTEPAPQRRPADGRNNSLLDDFALNFRKSKTGQGEAVTMRKFTGQCLDLDGDAGGKNGLAARPGTVPAVRGGVPERNASAIC